ncbi:immunity 22 family protein [Bacillus cereus]|uniref:Uncharacterized protein n=1 Tax=Bacillus cereus TaxID=1396 RepID=A0A2A7HSS8_BACCE|nr:immunity 22 family protein [Bacillus cereus]PEC20102.1 hypothetical protein COM96_21190 [Bacillus cereus]
MEYSGMVSVWFGISKSLQNLEEYVDIDYTIDGDSVHSKFGTSFEFGYYDEDNIEYYTIIARKEHGFPNKYLVLTEMTANAALVLDSVTDKVYSVNFEGGDELLLSGKLKESWPTFYSFLKEHFKC